MPISATPDAAIWNAAEMLPRAELEELQLRRLRETVQRVLRADGLGATSGLEHAERLIDAGGAAVQRAAAADGGVRKATQSLAERFLLAPAG